MSIEPSFVFADVIRAEQNSTDGDDDKIYFFFTEVSVEYEFVGKLMIPRIARVCKVRRSAILVVQLEFSIYVPVFKSIYYCRLINIVD